MKTRAAVAFEAKKPLEIVELDLEGPKAGEVWLKSRQPAFATRMPTRSTASTAKACFHPSSAMRVLGSYVKSAPA